jgi:DNA replication licensing factor MCM5
MNGINLSDIENKLMHFVKETKVDDVFIYREQLRSNALRGLYFLRVQMDHLIAFDETIVTYLRDDPNNTIKVFETAVLEIYKSVIFDESNLDMEENPNF